uniref:MATH domain-containing protein n=1 Tax=Bursaphelenchus xylophilus TaxID=6326 RepID=A0A1I7RV60_BURXY
MLCQRILRPLKITITPIRDQQRLAERPFGRFVSFYVQLIPGPYDPILKWPFQDTITLILYDQNKNATSRMDYRFELNPSHEVVDDSFVGRPKADKPNGWLGTDSFVEIENILTDGDYLVNETVYFGVCIST